ncbi:MAG: IS21 family transposase [Rhodococcus sp. (in: high G+C Gram-positive bacteria)]|nr:IS21 family transposase [Rhodococcus sp. (in: high G+C Gram-positive bacteria)]
MSLLLERRSYREIGAVLGCSQKSVAAAKKQLVGRGITADGLAQLTDADIAEMFPDGRSRVRSEYLEPDFGRVVASLKKNQHYTLLQAWRTYTGKVSELRKYGYSQYCALFSEFVQKHDLTAVLKHEPGKTMFIDWAGDTVDLVDAVTGVVTKAYLFVTVLPYSGCLWCRAFTDMRMPSWIAGHVGAFEFYGGVPRLLIPDNALTATQRRERGDASRWVTDRYQQLADHYGTSVLPTKVRSPKQKAAVESGVNVVNKRVIGYLAEDVWTTLDDLNEAIAERVHEINHDIRRVDGSTRWERFAEEESELLGPLPIGGFTEVEWKEAKVARNSHVTCDYQHYSVPHEYAGRLLRVRLAGSRVTVFDGQQIVCEHDRLTGRKGQYSTEAAHLPVQYRNVDGLWSRQWFLQRARAFGPATVYVIEQLIDRRPVETQGFLDCQNVLETLGKRNKQRLEAACQQLVNSGVAPSYTALKRLMGGINSDQNKPATIRPAGSSRKPRFEPAEDSGRSPEPPSGAYVRGADYYRRLDQERGR